MIVSRQCILNTLNILSANHQKVIDNYHNHGPSVELSPNEIMNIHNSHNALSLYNSIKQNYQII